MTEKTTFDFSAPEVAADPYDMYEVARNASRVFHLPELNGYMVTSFEDVTATARNHRCFSSRRVPLGAGDPELQAIVEQGYPPVPALVSCDPPEHTRYRKLVNGPFAVSAVSRHEPLIRQTVTELIDGFVHAGRVELMAEFAMPFTIRIIGSILGVPADGLRNFGRWSDSIAESVSGYLPRERVLECARDLVGMQHYFAELIDARRKDPGEDLITAMVTARADNERPLSVPEMLELIRIFVAGGTETTASLLCSVIYLLLRHPDQFAAVAADHSLIPQMLEEVLRFDSPGQWNPRMVYTDDVSSAGVDVPKGSRMIIAWAAANRDPAKFGPDADTFDIHRTNAQQHVALGIGHHYCLGAPLARLEARVACEQLLSRLRNIRLDTPDGMLPYAGHGTVRRLQRLPITFDAA